MLRREVPSEIGCHKHRSERTLRKIWGIWGIFQSPNSGTSARSTSLLRRSAKAILLLSPNFPNVCSLSVAIKVWNHMMLI